MDRRPLIRHIASSYDGTTIAVAEFEQYVQTWDISSLKRIAAFETTLDFGGHRIAISRDGAICAVGAYHVHGIATYDARTGAELWRRKDLKKVQTLRIGLDGQRLLCGFEGKSFEILNLVNGRSKTAPRGVEDIWESPYDPVMVFDRKRRDFKMVDREKKEIATLPRTTFAAIAFAFAPQKLCISESGGPTSCFGVEGQLLWKYEPGPGVHALRVGYNEISREFVAITWPFSKGGEFQLVKLDPDTGSSLVIDTLANAHEFEFCCRGSILVTSCGSVRDTATGKNVGQLAFF